MIKLIFVYFRLLEFSPDRIRTYLTGKEYRLLSLGLQRYDGRTRRQILKQLMATGVRSKLLFRRLIKIVKNDFLDIAELSLFVLEKSPLTDSSMEARLKKARTIYQDRRRREYNRKAFFASFTPKLDDKIFDKSKMKQLERVRQQLKKAIRLH